MNATKAPPLHVVILWRLAALWRNGDARERRWRHYRCMPRREAESFMRNQAPNCDMFEYKIQQ